MRIALLLAISIALLASAPLLAEDAEGADDGAFYVLYGYVYQSTGSPVPDGTVVKAVNLDRSDDNSVIVRTYTDAKSNGRYTLTFHAPGAPTSNNSMSYTDGDRVRITCTSGSDSYSSTHTVNEATGSSKRLDIQLIDTGQDESIDEWFEGALKYGLIVAVLVVAVIVVWYLFVPPKEG